MPSPAPTGVRRAWSRLPRNSLQDYARRPDPRKSSHRAGSIGRALAVHRFWNSVIEPVLEAVEPRVIVEIGADRGKNTTNILRYCVRRGAVAHVIDPLPKFSLEEWQQEYGEAVVFHRKLSLEALPAVPRMDVVLIDGDHNWYTVFHELTVIQSIAGVAERFPVVLLHDVDWPYGRRDLYYDPETIPSRYRHPFQRLGIRPGKSELLKEGGLNAGLANAVRENTRRNGVHTALEDFVADSPLEFHVATIPGLHGLGILVTKALMDRNLRFADVISSFDTKEFLVRQCHEIERSRINEMIRSREKRRPLKRQIRHLEAQLAEKSELAKEQAQVGTAQRGANRAGDEGEKNSAS
jgi:Methyltransferase domain